MLIEQVFKLLILDNFYRLVGKTINTGFYIPFRCLFLYSFSNYDLVIFTSGDLMVGIHNVFLWKKVKTI